LIDLRLGDCLGILPTIPDASVDAVITDPPYPEITREYGRWTEAEWHELMRGVVAEVRRILKPRGSAVFVLQPNSRKMGSLRAWPYEFQSWAIREWNIVQDVYWWNTTALPKCGQVRTRALPRPSVKLCVWLGSSHCFRDIDRVLKPLSASMQECDPDKQRNTSSPSCWRGHVRPRVQRRSEMVRRAQERGGSTPFNLLPIANAHSHDSGGARGHGSATPLDLCDWWTRYIVPPGGVICDPFMGSGTTGEAALKHGHDYIGIEKHEPYFRMAQRHLANVTPALAFA
jgi:DNA modification methylase